MLSTSFMRDLKDLIEKYNIDKITGFSSIKIARGIKSLLWAVYDIPSEKRH